MQPGYHARIAFKTIATIAATALLTWLTQSRILSVIVVSRDLSWLLSLAVVLGATLAVLLVSAVVLRYRDDRRASYSRRIEPDIRDAVSSCLASEAALGFAYVTHQLRETFSEHPSVTAHCFRQLFLALKGQHGDRLSSIANAIGLREYWQHVYENGSVSERVGVIRCLAHVAPDSASRFLHEAIRSSDEAIRVEAARTLAEVGKEEDFARIYEFARTQSLLVKAILAEDLRPHVAFLANGPVSSDLTSENERRLRHALDMLKAWSTSLPVSLDPLLRHEDRSMRVRALELITPIQATRSTQDALLSNLSNEPPEVVEAAALAAGRLYMSDLIPTLTALLTSEEGRVCSAAARALSRMGQMEPLQERIRAGVSPGAEAALEAFQMMHTGRGEYARV